MRMRWTNAAAADMQSISDYLKDNHPQYRQPTMRKLYQRIRAVKRAHYIGRPGIEGGYQRKLRAIARCSEGERYTFDQRQDSMFQPAFDAADKIFLTNMSTSYEQ